MGEINLMDRYPKSRRPIEARGRELTDDHRAIARRFAKSYFDGERLTGYGGYHYHPRFWGETVKRFRNHYRLADNARILDIGCAKGFMMRDFMELMPPADIRGIDVSRHAIDNADPAAKPFIQQASADALPFADQSFDLVIAINSIHNLPYEACLQSLREIKRVGRGPAFVMVDAWHKEAEHEALMQWNLTGYTFFHVDRWKQIFRDVGYTGDYWWFIAETD
jgi:ubiquinone/menaquinone biosynthesis C-methylase UbiE